MTDKLPAPCEHCHATGIFNAGRRDLSAGALAGAEAPIAYGNSPRTLRNRTPTFGFAAKCNRLAE